MQDAANFPTSPEALRHLEGGFMRLDLTVHLSPEDRKLLDRMATAQERAAAAAEKSAASLDSIDKYFQRLNRATTATITPGKVTEQE